MLGLHERKRSMPLWNFHNLDHVFLRSCFFFWLFQITLFNEFYTQKTQKGFEILGGTSSITYIIKRCFHFSDFRYGFPESSVQYLTQQICVGK